MKHVSDMFWPAPFPVLSSGCAQRPSDGDIACASTDYMAGQCVLLSRYSRRLGVAYLKELPITQHCSLMKLSICETICEINILKFALQARWSTSVRALDGS